MTTHGGGFRRKGDTQGRDGVHKTVDIELGADILGANRRIAEDNARLLAKAGVHSFDFMGSTGSGKTLLIEALIERLKGMGVRCAAITGDVAGDDDYRRLTAHGIRAANVNTDKDCHLDAHRVDHALEHLDLKGMDVLFVENVGNLVCPADFPLGTEKRIVMCSVTEGDDMIRKHPVIFMLADIVVINKVDLASAIEVDPQILVRDLLRIRPGAKYVLTDAKHGKGVDELLALMGIDRLTPRGNTCAQV